MSMTIGKSKATAAAVEALKAPKEANKRARRTNPLKLEELKRLQMNIPMSLHKALKDKAYGLDVEITFIIENLAEDFLASADKPEWLQRKMQE